jgi:hypothetical protein
MSADSHSPATRCCDGRFRLLPWGDLTVNTWRHFRTETAPGIPSPERRKPVSLLWDGKTQPTAVVSIIAAPLLDCVRLLSTHRLETGSSRPAPSSQARGAALPSSFPIASLIFRLRLSDFYPSSTKPASARSARRGHPARGTIMTTPEITTWRHSNKYTAESACEHCSGVIRHALVRYS